MTTIPDEPAEKPDVVPSGDPAPSPENPFDPALDPEGGEPEPGSAGDAAAGAPTEVGPGEVAADPADPGEDPGVDPPRDDHPEQR